MQMAKTKHRMEKGRREREEDRNSRKMEEKTDTVEGEEKSAGIQATGQRGNRGLENANLPSSFENAA